MHRNSPVDGFNATYREEKLHDDASFPDCLEKETNKKDKKESNNKYQESNNQHRDSFLNTKNLTKLGIFATATTISIIVSSAALISAIKKI